MKLRCTCCGMQISKSAFSDPNLCRNCERLMDGKSDALRFQYLDG